MAEPVTKPPRVERDQQPGDQAMRALAEALVAIALGRHAAGERWDSAAKQWRPPS